MKRNPEVLADWLELSQVMDARGKLTSADFDDFPFRPLRTFFVTHVPAGTVRGGHSHKEGEQILVCLSGRIKVELRSHRETQTVICQPDGRGLIIRAGIWAQQTYLDADSQLLVFCSHSYNRDSYLDEDGCPLS